MATGPPVLSQPQTPGTWCSEEGTAQSVPAEGFYPSGGYRRHPTFSILGGRRTSELIAEQNMDKGKGRKEPAAGLGTGLQKEFREVHTHET